ncbi:MAG: trigger factor [Pseudomonadota bacterium]
MNVKKIASEKLKQEFHVVIESADIDRRVMDSLASKSKKISMPGFRPGKVPMNVVRQRYESSAIQEVLNDVIQESSRKLLKENKLKPASQPTYDLDPYEHGKDFSFHLHVEALPEIASPDYSKIKIEKVTSVVDDKEVEQTIKDHAEAKMFFRPAPKDAAPAKDDRIVVSLETHVGKNLIKAFTVKDVNIRIGTGNFIFDFIEEALLNKKVGETFTVEHTFDAKYEHKSLAGKTAQFTVTVISHDVLKTLPVGTEYVEACGFESMDALKEQVRNNLEQELRHKIHLYHKRILLDVLSDLYTFDLPASMIKSEFDSIWGRLKTEMDEARKQGLLDPEDDKSDEELTKEYQVIAERRVRLGLLIAEIAQKEGIRLTDKMIQELVIQEARKYPGQERQVLDYYRNTPQSIDMLTAPALEDMVVLFMLNKIEVKEKVLTKDELYKLFVGILPGFEAESESKSDKKPKTKSEKPNKADESAKTSATDSDVKVEMEKPKKAKKA